MSSTQAFSCCSCTLIVSVCIFLLTAVRGLHGASHSARLDSRIYLECSGRIPREDCNGRTLDVSVCHHEAQQIQDTAKVHFMKLLQLVASPPVSPCPAEI